MLKSGWTKEKDILLLRPKKHSDQRVKPQLLRVLFFQPPFAVLVSPFLSYLCALSPTCHIWDLGLDRYGPKAIKKLIQKLNSNKSYFRLMLWLVIVFFTMESFERAYLAFQ